jgi:glycerophosphoryl diester phosphodiesterase
MTQFERGPISPSTGHQSVTLIKSERMLSPTWFLSRSLTTSQWIVLLSLLLPCSAWAQSSQGMHRLEPGSPAGLRELLKYTGDTLPLVSAHRGGSQAGFPENCLATFEHTLQHTFALLEVDPRRTKDGQFVLHHDTTLDRTTTGAGLLAERTLAEVKSLRLKDPQGNVTEYQIPTLEEAIRWARGKAVLVLDQKDLSVDERVEAIERQQAESYVMLIVYSLKDAQRVHAANPNIVMEYMIPNRDKFEEFAGSGIPWSNIVAFVGHTPPTDLELLEMLHAKGVCCLAGTSRNIDREYLENRQLEFDRLLPRYQELLDRGVDLIETDLPREVGSGLFANTPLPSSKASFFDR